MILSSLACGSSWFQPFMSVTSVTSAIHDTFGILKVYYIHSQNTWKGVKSLTYISLSYIFWKMHLLEICNQSSHLFLVHYRSEWVTPNFEYILQTKIVLENYFLRKKNIFSCGHFMKIQCFLKNVHNIGKMKSGYGLISYPFKNSLISFKWKL